ncbi:MAG: metallophosphoesterase [Candidatus Thermoplasmatota archaeon]
MNSTEIQPVIDHPALYIQKKQIMVIADLHIGIESELHEYGVNVELQTKKMTERVTQLCDEYKPKKIVIVGDVKHNIPSSTFLERNDVKDFLHSIKNLSEIDIVVGNHDGNIKKLVPNEINVHPSTGFTEGDVGFIHGHCWPSKKVMQKDTLVMAHTHPTIRLTDRRGFKKYEPCWLKTHIVKNEIMDEKYPSLPGKSELVVTPAFNPLCGGIAVNQEGIVGPIGRISDIGNADVYLLDGSSLGKVKNIQ